MNGKELLALFRRGLVPGPNESEEAFIKRAASHFPLSLPEWEEVAPLLQTEWGFAMDWVPLTYSSEKLLLWEGAVFWIREDGSSFIQLKKHSPEILIHEAVHAAREAFNEPVFEEFLAYATCRASWRRFLGPLFTHIWEFPLFALAIFFIPFFPWISSLVVAFFFGRLLFRHFFFSRMKRIVSPSVLLCLTDREIFTGKILYSSLRAQLIEELKKL